MSSKDETRLKSMIFVGDSSTSQSELYNGPLPRCNSVNYPERPEAKRKQFTPVKHLGTLSNWKQKPVPFDLFIRPDPILGHDPRVMPKPLEAPKAVSTREARAARPHPLMTPAVNWDIVDDEPREIILKNIYTTTKMVADQDIQISCGGATVKAEMTGKFAPPNPLALPKCHPAYVSPEWKRESLTWDRRNRRMALDPTKEFWLRKADLAPDNPPVEKKKLSHGFILES